MSLVEEDDFLLYKWQAGWGLPSIDPASTQAEVRAVVLCGREKVEKRFNGIKSKHRSSFFPLLLLTLFFHLSLFPRSISASRECP